MNSSKLAQFLIKKKPEFDVRLLKISNHAESDMYLNLAHKLGKKSLILGIRLFQHSLL